MVSVSWRTSGELKRLFYSNVHAPPYFIYLGGEGGFGGVGGFGGKGPGGKYPFSQKLLSFSFATSDEKIHLWFSFCNNIISLDIHKYD